jgi:DNA-directed RNA polymerase sigma subunit (sigma70/sigma32)
MKKTIKLCKICEIILDNNRVCRCGKRHGAIARDGLVCKDCYEKYYNTLIYEKMRKRVKAERIEKAIEKFQEALEGEEYDLKILSQRERKIVIMRFGLENGEHRILETVAKKFNLTIERIRQIEAESLKKLRKNLKKVPSENT